MLSSPHVNRHFAVLATLPAVTPMAKKLPESLYRAGVSVLTLAVAVLLLASSVELHDSRRQHRSIGSPTEIAVDAQHAGQTAHLERSEIVLVSHCPECLLRSQSVGKVAAPDAGAVDSASPRRLRGVPGESRPPSNLGRLIASRAPPRS